MSLYGQIQSQGVQWPSGRMLDLRLRGCVFELHRHRCVVSLSQTHLSLLSTDSTQEDLSQHNLKVIDWDVKNQIKQTNTMTLLYGPHHKITRIWCIQKNNGVDRPAHPCSLTNNFVIRYLESKTAKLASGKVSLF